LGVGGVACGEALGDGEGGAVGGGGGLEVTLGESKVALGDLAPDA
jgi:hypothetical protein